MPRIALGVEYDGSRYCGWQRQDHCESVQGALEQALQKLFSASVRIHGAGRTDAGVHATGQVAHFDIDRDLDVVFVSHPLDAIFELVRRDAQGAAGFGCALGNLVQLVRNQAGLEHAVARLADERGDVDAHRAHERAAAAHRAGVVNQFLPFAQLLHRDFAFQAK